MEAELKAPPMLSILHLPPVDLYLRADSRATTFHTSPPLLIPSLVDSQRFSSPPSVTISLETSFPLLLSYLCLTLAS